MIVKIMTAVFSRGADYGLRMFPLPHGDALRTVQTLDWTDEQGHAKDDAPIMDSEAEDPVLRLPADSAEGELLESTVLDSSYLQVAWGPRQDDERSYFILDVKHSGTAPDDWWELRLRLDPFAQLESLTNLKGRWDATPEPNDAKLTFAPISDEMVYGDSLKFPCLPMYQGEQLMFVKISASEYVYVNYDGTVIRNEDTPATYSMLVCSDPNKHVSFGPSDKVKIYPSLKQIVGDLDNLGSSPSGQPVGLTPKSILDISISVRSPMQMQNDRTLQEAGVLLKAGDVTLYASSSFMMTSQTYIMEQPVLTDMQLYTGTAEIHTTNDDNISAIPAPVLNEGDIHLHCISDLTGIYTELTISGSRIMMPEGKLPYVGSAWSEYAVAQRSYDRENMTLAIQNAKSEAVQNSLMSVANGVFTGALTGGPAGAAAGVATAGLGIAGDVMSLQRNERTARVQQDLKEKMIMSSIGTTFNTGYGLEYVRKSKERRARIQYSMPLHLTQQMFDDYVKWHGYPAGGLESTVVMKQGYLQGYITDMTFRSKRERDRMNRELTEGVRFV